MRRHPATTVLIVWLWVLILTACSTITPELRLAQELEEQQNWDRAVAAYREALRQDPLSKDLAEKLTMVKTRAAQSHFQRGRQFLKNKRLPEALQEFQIAIGLNPVKLEHHAALGDAIRLRDARRALQHAEKLVNLGRLEEAMAAYEGAIELDPTLTQALEGITALALEQKARKTIGGTAEAVTLRFQNTRLKQVFEILARTANLNIMFEKDVRDDLVTIFTKNTPFDEALNLILITNQLFARRVAPNTLLIIPDTKQKRQQYQDLMIRTFYLSNAKAKDTANLLRTILETKRVYVNEKLNAVVIRDQPAKLFLAEQIILANDRPDSEVVLDVEVLEVTRREQEKLGLTFGQEIRAGFFPPGTTAFSTGPQTFTYEQLTGLGTDALLFTLPSSLLLEFFKTESGAKTLASPKLRVGNNQKASINVGDKQPILLSTTNVVPGQAATGALPTTSTVTSIEFKDTGIKLNLEPTIHLTGEITIKLKIEITSLGELVQLQADPLIEQFRFGTRNAETTLTLRDGETVVLAGLIREDNRKTRTPLPGLDDVPFIKDLFSKDIQKQTTEIIIAITPRIVRHVKTPSPAKQLLWSGTANHFATKPLFSEQPAIPFLTSQNGTRGITRNGNGAPKVSTGQEGMAPPAPPQPGQRPATLPDGATSLAKIALDPSEISTGVGQTVKVALKAQALPKVQQARMTLTYNPKVLEFTQVLPGTFFPPGDSGPAMTVSAVPGAGKIVVQLGRKGKFASGDGLLATVVFKTKAKGSSPLVIRQSNLMGETGQSFSITVQHGIIRVD